MNRVSRWRVGERWLFVVAALSLSAPGLAGCHLVLRYDDVAADAALDGPPDTRAHVERSRSDSVPGRRDGSRDTTARDQRPRDAWPRDAPPQDAPPPDAPPPDACAGCTINGACHASGSLNASNACERCAPASSGTSWTAVKGEVVTLAGTGVAGYLNGAAATAMFNAPRDVVIESPGVLYVTDGQNGAIRKISDGQVTTLAGTGTLGFQNGSTNQAMFNEPHGLVVVGTAGSGQEKVYVADSANFRIREIASGSVSTFAGSGTKAFADGDPTTAAFIYPRSVAATGGGMTPVTLYIADDEGHRIRVISWTGSKHEVATLAGDGTAGLQDGSSPWFRNPKSVALGPGAQLLVYVSDGGNNVIRKIIKLGLNIVANTVAGSMTGAPGHADGPLTTQALFNFPHGIAVDSAGDIYVADAGNRRIRKITFSTNSVSTIAGNGVDGFKDGPTASAMFRFPHGLAVDTANRVYVADRMDHRVRVVCP